MSLLQLFALLALLFVFLTACIVSWAVWDLDDQGEDLSYFADNFWSSPGRGDEEREQ